MGGTTLSRRRFIEAGIGLTIANFAPTGRLPLAHAAAEDDRIAPPGVASGDRYGAAMMATLEG